MRTPFMIGVVGGGLVVLALLAEARQLGAQEPDRQDGGMTASERRAVLERGYQIYLDEWKHDPPVFKAPPTGPAAEWIMFGFMGMNDDDSGEELQPVAGQLIVRRRDISLASDLRNLRDDVGSPVQIHVGQTTYNVFATMDDICAALRCEEILFAGGR